MSPDEAAELRSLQNRRVANPAERDYGQNMLTPKALVALAIVVGGSVAAFGIYTFG